ncbi:MAG: czcC [Proteobacteria bacterium]|nr:czcC [Pseudomonadota bacterium]
MSSPIVSRPLRAWIALPFASLGACLGASLIAFGALAAEPKSELADLLALARRMNPDIAAMRLDADAAGARIDVAGALDDPKLKIELTSPRDDFGRVSSELYEIRQMLPFWGKRALKREVAEWEARKAYASARDIENQVVWRAKVAYAEYHTAHLALDETKKLAGTLKRLTDIARARYAENAAPQSDVTGAASEAGALASELSRIAADKAGAAARLNRLLGRAADTPLAAKPAARPIPPLKTLRTDDLIARAKAGSPAIDVGLAGVGAADGARRLAERNWLPDVELGLGAMRENGRFESYQVMVEFSLPLQWGAKRAEQQEAAAMVVSARTRLDALRLDIDADLRTARADLDALVARQRVIAGTTLPQARIALDTAVKGYGLGRGDFPAVLGAEQALRRAIIESITTTYEEQVALATIERIVGEDL